MNNYEFDNMTKVDNKTEKASASYILGQIFGIVCMACLSALLIGVTVKILQWMLF